MLRIGILNLRKPTIGPKIFLRKLSVAIEENNYAKVVNALSPFFDIAIFNNFARNIYKKKYILRLDGLFFDIRNTVGDNKKLNGKIFYSLERSNGIIFQSNFSKKLFERFYGEIHIDNTVINNGSSITFSEDNKRLKFEIPKGKIIILAVAHWRRHKRLKEIVELYKELTLRFNQLYLIVVGPNAELPRSNDILYIPTLEQDEIYSLLTQIDLMFHFSWLDNCPNSVVEALCLNVPVLCTNQGGTRELIEISNGGIVSNADDEFNFEPVDLYNPPKPNMNILYEDAVRLIENLEFYKNKINTRMININNVAKKYVEFAHKIYSLR